MELGYQKIDKYDEQCVSEMAEHYKAILRLLGEDPEREGLLKSPERIAKAMLFFTNGYDLNLWLGSLKHRQDHLSAEQITALNDIGMKWRNTSQIIA